MDPINKLFEPLLSGYDDMSWRVTSIRADPQGPPAGALLNSTSPVVHNFVYITYRR